MNNELLTALLSVQPGGYPTPNSQWKCLFDFYNNNLKIGERPLGMGCRPCYDKVYQYCRDVLLTQFIEGQKNQKQLA